MIFQMYFYHHLDSVKTTSMNIRDLKPWKSPQLLRSEYGTKYIGDKCPHHNQCMWLPLPYHPTPTPTNRNGAECHHPHMFNDHDKFYSHLWKNWSEFPHPHSIWSECPLPIIQVTPSSIHRIFLSNFKKIATKIYQFYILSQLFLIIKFNYEFIHSTSSTIAYKCCSILVLLIKLVALVPTNIQDISPHIHGINSSSYL